MPCRGRCCSECIPIISALVGGLNEYIYLITVSDCERYDSLECLRQSCSGEKVEGGAWRPAPLARSLSITAKNFLDCGNMTTTLYLFHHFMYSDTL